MEALFHGNIYVEASEKQYKLLLYESEEVLSANTSKNDHS